MVKPMDGMCRDVSDQGATWWGMSWDVSVGRLAARTLAPVVAGAGRGEGELGRGLEGGEPVGAHAPASASVTRAWSASRSRRPAMHSSYSGAPRRGSCVLPSWWNRSPTRRTLVVMTAAAKKIFAEALALPEQERVALMDALADSILGDDHDDLSPEWTAEVARRIEAVERGESRLIPGDEVEASSSVGSPTS